MIVTKAKRKPKFELKESASLTLDTDALNQMREDFLWTIQRRDISVFRRQRTNYDTRNCKWANQSEDGKKWHKDAFPWKGAADSRVPLVDLYCNQDVALLMVLWRRSRTIVSGHESNDMGFANRLTQVVRWMKYTQMTESAREMRLLANYFVERGAGVLQTCWDRRQQLGHEKLDLDTLEGLSLDTLTHGQEGGEISERDERIIQLPDFIMDPSREADAVAALGELYQDVKPARLRVVVRDLRTDGVARFPRPYLVRDRPAVVALSPNEDIYIDPEAAHLQEAASIFRRELISETALRSRVYSHGWDEGWVEHMLATQRGQLTADFDGQLFRRNPGRWSSQAQNPDRLFEVIHGYQRRGDADGVPGIYYTVFSPGLVKDKLVAKHELLDYDHGEYPFVHYSREVRSRILDDTRGYGEIAATWQNQIKTEWDSRIDRSAIATLPPYYYPEGSAPDAWGPGVGVPTSRPDEYGFMPTPKYDPGSQEVQATVRSFADEYFGRSPDEARQVEKGISRQDFGELWMGYNAQSDTQMLQLMQQYMPDEFYFRIVGSAKGAPIHASREEIQGQFDVSITFNTDDLDSEKVGKKMALMEKALMMDVSGRIDRDEALTVVFEMVDPNLGERLLRDPQAASASELEDEDSVFTKMRAGVPVDVKPGQAHKLRLERLEALLEHNPKAQEQLDGDDQFRELVETRVKSLRQQIHNQGTAQMAGQLGGMPASAQLGMA